MCLLRQSCAFEDVFLKDGGNSIDLTIHQYLVVRTAYTNHLHMFLKQTIHAIFGNCVMCIYRQTKILLEVHINLLYVQRHKSLNITKKKEKHLNTELNIVC